MDVIIDIGLIRNLIGMRFEGVMGSDLVVSGLFGPKAIFKPKFKALLIILQVSHTFLSLIGPHAPTLFSLSLVQLS